MSYDKKYLKIREEWFSKNPGKDEEDFFFEVYGIPKYDPNAKLQSFWTKDFHKACIEFGDPLLGDFMKGLY